MIQLISFSNFIAKQNSENNFGVVAPTTVQQGVERMCCGCCDVMVHGRNDMDGEMMNTMWRNSGKTIKTKSLFSGRGL